MCHIYSRNLPVNSTESVGRIRLLARPKPPAVFRAQPNWSMHTITLNEILLLGGDAEKVGRGPEHHGRLVHPGCVGMDRIREWMDVCEEFHQLQCIGEMGRNAGRIPDCLHLIDVKENRLVQAKQGMRYCALSYVWGAVTTVSLCPEGMSHVQTMIRGGGRRSRRACMRCFWWNGMMGLRRGSAWGKFMRMRGWKRAPVGRGFSWDRGEADVRGWSSNRAGSRASGWVTTQRRMGISMRTEMTMAMRAGQRQ
jgi:hypothetical protein